MPQKLTVLSINGYNDLKNIKLGILDIVDL